MSNPNYALPQENIEWCDIWLPNLNTPPLPRVLLIGDSITRAYYPHVERLLAGKAYVGRLTTSRSLGDPALLWEVETVLNRTRFDVIHFNNGLHGWDYSETEYAAAFPRLLETFAASAPEAQLIWATTTSIRLKDNLEALEARTDRVRVRNALALECIAGQEIAVDDLFSLTLDRPELFSADAIHFNEAGNSTLAEQVLQSILDLPGRP